MINPAMPPSAGDVRSSIFGDLPPSPQTTSLPPMEDVPTVSAERTMQMIREAERDKDQRLKARWTQAQQVYDNDPK